MKLTCPHSGIEYSVNSGYGTNSAVHPATAVPLKKLVTQLADYHSGKIASDTDRYLYLLAWFKHLPSVTFRDPADSQAPTSLAANAEILIRVVLTASKLRHLSYPTIVVSRGSPISTGLRNWLDTTQEILSDAATRSSNQAYNITMSRLESTLDRITTYTLKSNVSRASKLVALWAATAGQFDTSSIVTTPDGGQSTISDYWQFIITLAFKESHTELLKSRVLPADISELIEHCEDSIPHGSQYAYELMKRLRSAQKQLDELYGTKTEIVREHIQSGTEALIEPTRRQFKSPIDYLKARVKWQAAMLEAKKASNAAVVVADEETEEDSNYGEEY